MERGDRPIESSFPPFKALFPYRFIIYIFPLFLSSVGVASFPPFYLFIWLDSTAQRVDAAAVL